MILQTAYVCRKNWFLNNKIFYCLFSFDNKPRGTNAQDVQESFRQLLKTLQEDYLPHLRPNIGATSLPKGQEFYRACLAFHTSTDLSAQSIHQMGIEEVARIEAEMCRIKDEMKYGHLTLAQFADTLKRDPANFFKSGQELVDSFRTIIETRIEPRLLDLFHRKPASRLEITETPATTPNAPAAYYIAGTEDGSRPGKLFANTHKFASQPKYEMISLSLHEANPGHHLQVLLRPFLLLYIIIIYYFIIQLHY